LQSQLHRRGARCGNSNREGNGIWCHCVCHRGWAGGSYGDRCRQFGTTQWRG
jgi:hypothetical protein